MKVLFKNLYAKQILVSTGFHTVSLTFNNIDSIQAFKHELKQFLLSVELNDLEILK